MLQCQGSSYRAMAELRTVKQLIGLSLCNAEIGLLCHRTDNRKLSNIEQRPDSGTDAATERLIYRQKVLLAGQIAKKVIASLKWTLFSRFVFLCDTSLLWIFLLRLRQRQVFDFLQVQSAEGPSDFPKEICASGILGAHMAKPMLYVSQVAVAR